MKKTIFILLTTTIFPSHAYAYTDPGSGMLLIQGIIAVLGIGLAFLKNPITFIKLLFSKKSGSDERENSSEQKSNKNI